MKEIFAELYSKVLNFFQVEKGEDTKSIASNRLKLVLMHDRTKLDPLTLEKMRSEMVEVISKYVVIDNELLELNLAGEGDSIALMLNIPVVRAKTEEELQEQEELEALDAEELEEDDDETEESDEEIESDEDSEEEVNDEEEDEVVLDSEDDLDEALDSEDSETPEDEIFEKDELTESEKNKENKKK